MNIKKAKEYIKDTVLLYLKKDEFGEYRIPVARQRPVFLIGAPGIGKTAIMEQIAQELSIGLVAYSMTHHTRQSALGLPVIEHKKYENQEYQVSDYTMSEIISSVYEVMEQSGMREGILFLDEINCVSETLSPSMLQFLQYKVFGRHQVPQGWVIVTAGNPPEYNKSVREFDVVTLDRLKVMEVEADYTAWKEYASAKGIHNAVMSYLELKREHFYHIETTIKGKSYITARGWEDLSQILQLYEEEQLPVDENLVGQYLRNEKIVKEFTAYYDLYNKYKNDYKIPEILEGKATREAIEKAKAAGFDERLSLLGMLMDRVLDETRHIMWTAESLQELRKVLVGLQQVGQEGDLVSVMEKQILARKNLLRSLAAAGALSDLEKYKNRRIIQFLEQEVKAVRTGSGVEKGNYLEHSKLQFQEQVTAMKERTQKAGRWLHHVFRFAEMAFEGGNEMLILVTELTVNEYSARYIATFGCEDYQKYSQDLMLSDRQKFYMAEIEKLDL